MPGPFDDPLRRLLVYFTRRVLPSIGSLGEKKRCFTVLRCLLRGETWGCPHKTTSGGDEQYTDRSEVTHSRVSTCPDDESPRTRRRSAARRTETGRDRVARISCLLSGDEGTPSLYAGRWAELVIRASLAKGGPPPLVFIVIAVDFSVHCLLGQQFFLSLALARRRGAFFDGDSPTSLGGGLSPTFNRCPVFRRHVKST